jgi:uncharacterized protein (TIGR02246 family)
MLRNGWLIGCLGLAALTSACSTAPAPMADTRDADVRAVKDVEAAWMKDLAAKDADKFVSYYTEGAVGLYPGSAIANGKPAIKAILVPYLADPNFSMMPQQTRSMASKGGDMVYTLGTYTMTMTDSKTKQPATYKGKYLTIYAKQADGSWKAVADTFNSDSM